jgi:hypothetical protein
MTKRVYVLGIGLALVSIAWLITEAALTPRAGITRANFQRLHRGMTFAEVRRILGSPTSGRHLGREWGRTYRWRKGDNAVLAWFHPADTLLIGSAVFGPEEEVEDCRDEKPPSLFEKLRGWLSW